ncbi:matrix protein [Alphacytorhabdovirus ribes]|nr:matrix protein [Black currant cytorhabdovirus 1]
MSLNTLSWYRLSFKDSYWRFDSTDITNDSTICSLKSKELFSSGLKNLFPNETSLVEILSQMEEKDEIMKMNLIADSDLLGHGIMRCEFIFPKEVYIPSRHDLSTGMKEAALDNRVVTLHGMTYISSGNLKIGISKLTPEMKTIVLNSNPKAFIGCMDINPFGLGVSTSSPK